MPKRLVIVESPAKARTIAGYLGPEFEVDSSIGHVRDLPERAADIPAKYKKEPWARLGVDVENDFVPLYVIDADKKQRVADLKKRLAGADELLLATDEDGLITPLMTTERTSPALTTALVKKIEQVTVVVAVSAQFPTWVLLLVTSMIELLVWLFSPVPDGKTRVIVSAWPAAIPPVVEVLKLTV